MKSKTIGAAAVAAAFAAAIAASCATQAHAAPAHATQAHATPAHTGKTHLLVWSVNSDGPRFRALVTGAVGDYGPGTTVLPDGQVDPEHSSELELTLSHGSFRLNIATIHQDIIKAFGHWQSNATCSGSISFTAQAPVVAGSGTGAYRGITGSFSMKVSIDEVDVKPACDGTGQFASQLILMDGSGNVSY